MKKAYKVINAHTNEIIGFTNRAGLDHFCDMIYRPVEPYFTAPRGTPGWMLGFHRFHCIYVGEETMVPEDTWISQPVLPKN